MPELGSRCCGCCVAVGVRVAVGVGLGDAATTLKLTVMDSHIFTILFGTPWCCNKRVSSYNVWCTGRNQKADVANLSLR